MGLIQTNLRELDAWERKLKLSAVQATGIAKKALYEGARIAADKLRESVLSLDRVPDVEANNAAKRGEPTVLSVKQKIGLAQGLGITRMRVQPHEINVRVGFSGYNSVVTKRWPKGQPNQMVAGSCESGSSAMIKQPFIRTTQTNNSAAMQRAMIRVVTEAIDEILED